MGRISELASTLLAPFSETSPSFLASPHGNVPVFPGFSRLQSGPVSLPGSATLLSSHTTATLQEPPGSLASTSLRTSCALRLPCLSTCFSLPLQTALLFFKTQLQVPLSSEVFSSASGRREPCLLLGWAPRAPYLPPPWHCIMCGLCTCLTASLGSP